MWPAPNKTLDSESQTDFPVQKCTFHWWRKEYALSPLWRAHKKSVVGFTQTLPNGFFLLACPYFLWNPNSIIIVTKIPLQCRRCRFDPWIGKIPWTKKWKLILVFLPGKSHGQASLVGYTPWGSKRSDMSDWAQHKAWVYTAHMSQS